MQTITATPTTALDLFAALHPFGPAADGEELVFDLDPPAELVPALAVLHTGIRALLVGRVWYGERSDWPGLTVLNPSAPIPTVMRLLCVEGDGCWDRIHPATHLYLPRLFVPDTSNQKPRRFPRS